VGAGVILRAQLHNARIGVSTLLFARNIPSSETTSMAIFCWKRNRKEPTQSAKRKAKEFPCAMGDGK
jgi:hypothetical protein